MGPIPLLLHGRHGGPTVTYRRFHRWIVPWRFTSLTEEYDALRAGLGLIDVSTQGVIEVRGHDRLSFLNALLTNDLKRIAPGSARGAALLDASAKLVADVLVINDPDVVWLLCDIDHAATVAQVLERYHVSEDVAVINHERSHAILALEGPEAMRGFRELVGASAAASLKRPGQQIMIEWEQIPARFVRQSWIGGDGLLCLVPAQAAPLVWNLLGRAGEPLGLRFVGWEALNIARIEAGIPWIDVDMDATNLLPETGLVPRLVSDTKGCYLGQEIIARLQTYGSMSKRLMHLVIEGDRVPEPGDQIVSHGHDPEEPLGQVTSACSSVALARPLAMGYVKRGAYAPGTRVEIVSGATRVPAMVSERLLAFPITPLRSP